MPLVHRPIPSIQDLREAFIYDPVTGIVRWRVHPPGRVVTEAGTPTPYGYVHIGFQGSIWRAHRLIWGIHHGEDPGDAEIDHRDCVRHHNWIDNLRKSDRFQQIMNKKVASNSSSGFSGVKSRPHGRWNVSIRVAGHTYNMGNHKSFDFAVALRISAERLYFGEFARDHDLPDGVHNLISQVDPEFYICKHIGKSRSPLPKPYTRLV